MANLVIPVSVQLGNSLQALKSVYSGFDNLGKSAKEANNSLQGFANVPLDKTITAQLKQAKAELNAIVAKFGETGPEVDAAAEKVRQLQKVIGDAADASKRVSLGGGAEAFAGALSNIGQAAVGLAGGLTLLGYTGKDTQKTLLKLQGALAFTQAIGEVPQLVKSFKTLGLVSGQAFTAIVNGIIAATGATRAFAAAIASTGIGLLVVGIGIAISKFTEYKASVDEAQKKQEEFAESIKSSFTDATKKAGNEMTALGRNINLAKINLVSQSAAIKQYNETIGKFKGIVTTFDEVQKGFTQFSTEYINSVQVKAAADQAYNQSFEELSKARLKRIDALNKNISIADRDRLIKEAQTLEESSFNHKSAADKIYKNWSDWTDRMAGLDQSFLDNLDKLNKENSALRKSGIDREIQVVTDGRDELLKVIDDSNLAESEKAKKRAIVTENSELKISDIKKKYAKEAADKLKQKNEEILRNQDQANSVLYQLQLRNSNDTQKKVLEIERQFNEDRKVLAKAGISDFTALEADKQKRIKQVYIDSNKAIFEAQRNYELQILAFIGQGLLKQIELRTKLLELGRRAEISSIKDSGQQRLEELKDAERKELSEYDNLYNEGKIKLEQYLQAKAAIEAYYRNERNKTLTDEQQKELQRVQEQQGFLTDALSSATEAAVNAITEGGDPFAAAFKSLASSLGTFLINIGKEGLKAAIALKLLKKSIAGPQGIFASLAVIALGALIKAAFNKKAEKGFARGGYIYGPGTETSDSIPARLSKGEYVIRAKSVRRYGRDFFDKFNKGIPEPEWSKALVNRSAGDSKALVNRNDISQLGLDSGSRALVNRMPVRRFAEGGYVDPFASYSKALVNRFESNPLGLDSGSRAIVNRPIPDTPRVTTKNVDMGGDTGGFMPYIAETKISGQDLRIILSRADKRYSNVT